MTTKAEEIAKAIEDLLVEGERLKRDARPRRELPAQLGIDYEIWYSKASPMIAQLAPDRYSDFRSYYKPDSRKSAAYIPTASRYLEQSDIPYAFSDAYDAALNRQLAILAGMIRLATSVLRDVKTILRAEILDSDLLVAREMLKSRHLRCAGVIAGVVLETHLASVGDRRQIKVTKKKPTLSDWNDALKDNGAYDIPMWRLIQRLTDIRNLCAHSGGADPKPDQVQDLLDGTDKVIKEVF